MTSITVLSLRLRADVRPGEGRKDRKSDARAQRQQSTVPVGALRPMLTYRLTGTTEDSGSRPERTQPSSTPAWPVTRPHAKPHQPGIFASHGEPPRRLAVADLRKRGRRLSSYTWWGYPNCAVLAVIRF